MLFLKENIFVKKIVSTDVFHLVNACIILLPCIINVRCVDLMYLCTHVDLICGIKSDTKMPCGLVVAFLLLKF